MTSRHVVRPVRLAAIAVVIALVTSLFSATGAHAAGVSIRGKVFKPGGGALSGLAVNLYSESADYYTREKSTTTRSDGTYSFSSLPTGSLDSPTYVVSFGEGGKTYAPEYWNNQVEIVDATRITPRDSSVSNVNATMALGGTIKGTVRRSAGTGVANVKVAAYREGDGNDLEYQTSAFSAEDGSYALRGLLPGRYKVEFNPPTEGPDAELALEYWDNARSIEDSTNISVSSGEVAGGINALLDMGGRVSGKLTGPAGEPIKGAYVFGYPGHGGGSVGSVAVTDADGTYMMRGVSAGEQRLEFLGPLDLEGGLGEEESTYSREVWDDQAGFTTAHPITIEAGVTSTGKDARLELSSATVVSTAPPSISGSPKTGETLTAVPGVWSPVVTRSSYRYRWFADGSVITGQTQNTLEPEEGQLGKGITVEVTAHHNYGSGVATSASTEPVTTGVLRNTVEPIVRASHGTEVGEGVHLDHEGEWSVDSVSRSWQWLADGQAIPGAIATGFTITADQVGKKVSVRETAKKPGLDSVSVVSNETVPVIKGTIDYPGIPKISGWPIVGVPLTVTGTLGGSRTHAFQWLADGVEIPSGNELVFTPTDAQLGEALTVRVTVSLPGYNDAVVTSSKAATVVESGFYHVSGSTPSVLGTPRVGQTLSVNRNYWSPNGLTFSYEWLADGAVIPGADDPTFKPTSAEGGKRISIKLTGSLPGFTPDSRISVETAPVTTSTLFGAPQDFRATSSTVTTIALGWTKVEEAVKYRIYYGIGTGTRTKVEVGDVTSTTLKGLKPGTSYSIDVAALKADGTRSAYSRRITVTTKSLTPPTAFASPTQHIGSVDLTWKKVPGVPKYRIYYGIGTGARTTVEVGNVSSTTVKGLKPGTTYRFHITSLLIDGTRSGYSRRIDATTVPFHPPTDLASPSATTSTIDVTWTKAPHAVKYRLYIGIGIGTRTRIEVGDVSGLTIKGLKSKTTYTIDVSAISSDGTRSSYTKRIAVITD